MGTYMSSVKIEPNYKVSIPKEARDVFRLEVGDEVETITRKDSITFRKKKETSVYTPTKRELHSIKKGRADYAKGNYITLEQLFHELDNPPRRTRKKAN